MKFTAVSLKTALLLTISAFIACQAGPDYESMRAEILEIHNRFIEAHLNKDIGFMSADISADYMFISNGEIRRPAKEEITEQFTSYLNTTEFSEYRYLEEPVIGFSKEGSLAWSAARLKVAAKKTNEDGTESSYDVVYAYTTIFERRDGKWIRLSETSTNN